MKKHIIFITIMAILFNLTGCSNTDKFNINGTKERDKKVQDLEEKNKNITDSNPDESVKYEAYIKEFCKDYDYIGKYEYNSILKQYDIIISKGADNGGAFLDEAEYKELTQEQLQGTLEMLHKGF